MTPDFPSQPQRLLLLGLPHPLTRVLVRYVRGVLATCDPPVDVVLMTEEQEVALGEAAVHLRPEATAALDLVESVMPEVGARALAARMDERWRDVPRLAAERVATSPAHAVAVLSASLGVPVTAGMFAAADAGLPYLREELAASGHPLAFALALDLRATGQDPVPEQAEPSGAAQLDGVEGDPPLAVSSGTFPELPTGGGVGGSERSAAAAARTAARLAASGGGLENRVFVLAGERWAVLPAGES